MTLASGTTLGPYEIVAPLGAGGMGEVYRARDTKLDRDVAIKVLPETFARDPERVARFQREAKVLASLNHPNIAAIYGFEEAEKKSFLVMELVEGETLAERLRSGAMPVDEAIEFGKQIAEALEAAHEKGVLHRDLKPGNVMVRPDGTVKVLDFGLAKAFVGGTSGAALPDSPTITVEHTRPGIVLGTAAYMSPEQARGKPLDKRTDIWSFGCVLYECLTGTRPFAGETTSDTIAKILERDPDWDALPANTPPAVQLLLRRCLQKDRKRRLNDIGDARLELDDTLSGSMQAWAGAVLTVESRRKLRLARAPWVLATLLAVVTLACTVAYYRLATRQGPVIRSFIPPPENARFVFTGDLAGPVIVSPDGSALAFVTRGADGEGRLWVRPLDADTARVLAGTDGATFPFWSADSRSIGFFANEKLRRVAASGGPPITLCEAPMGKGGTWNREGTILFAPDFRSEILRVSASGGTPTPVTELDESKHTTHRWPYFLPDGKHFVYLAANHDLSRRKHDAAYFASLDGMENRLVLRTKANVAFASGFLLFMRDSALMAQSFDAKRGQLGGEPVPIAEKVQYDPGIWRGVFAASQNGILAFQVGGDVPGTKIVWFDRSGKKLGSIGEEGVYFGFRLSPDGKRLALDVGDPGDIWIYELARGVRTRVTFDPVDEDSAIWSPDGTRIAYTSRVRPDGHNNIYQKLSSGAGGEEMLHESDVEVWATDWSPDGRFLLYSQGNRNVRTQVDIWVLPLSGDRKPFAFLQTPFAAYHAQFSPDGRWIAYTSNESGRVEVYVAPFHAPTAVVKDNNGEPRPAWKWQISTRGGYLPRWRRDGKELFYQALDRTLMVAEVNGEGSVFEVGAVQPLFIPTPTASWFAYDVSLDGQRFVVSTIGEEDISSVTLVVNWTAKLGK